MDGEKMKSKPVKAEDSVLFDFELTEVQSKKKVWDESWLDSFEQRDLAQSTSLGRQSVNKDLPVKGARSCKKTRAKKPDGMPQRPLSAYNLFFKEQRERIVNERTEQLRAQQTTNIARRRIKKAKISFEELAKIIGVLWKNIDPQELQRLKSLAAVEAERYKVEMDEYLRRSDKARKQLNRKSQCPNDGQPHKTESPLLLPDSTSSSLQVDKASFPALPNKHPFETVNPRENYVDTVVSAWSWPPVNEAIQREVPHEMGTTSAPNQLLSLDDVSFMKNFSQQYTGVKAMLPFPSATTHQALTCCPWFKHHSPIRHKTREELPPLPNERAFLTNSRHSNSPAVASSLHDVFDTPSVNVDVPLSSSNVEAGKAESSLIALLDRAFGYTEDSIEPADLSWMEPVPIRPPDSL